MEKQQEHTHKWLSFGCKDATFLMTKSQFSTLSFSEKTAYYFHILICKYCRRFNKQTNNITHKFKSTAENDFFTMSTEEKKALKGLIEKNR